MATEKRLIDANALDYPEYFYTREEATDPFIEGFHQGKIDAINDIKALAPTVDAVEVVRCRECKFGDMCSIREAMAVSDMNAYCYRGERK